MPFVIKNRKVLFAGVSLSMLCWGLSWPSAKILLRYGQPLEIATIRFFFTFTSMVILLPIIGVPLTIARKGLPSLFVATLLVGSYSICFFTGMKTGMPGAGGVLVTTMTPLVTFILSVWLSNRKLAGNEWIGLGLGLLGSVFLLRLWNQASHLLDSGNAYFLMSTILWSFLSRYTAKSGQFGSPLAFSVWMYAGCVLFLLAFVNPINLWHILQHADHIFWVNMMFNAVINTGIATTFYFMATAELGAERTSSFIYIVPFAAALFSWIFINETLHWNTVSGGLLGLIAVWMINFRAFRKK